ncbi:glucosaminidase domain-containing protein [Patescibacteria group bacterium]|nr:glucosaminidase domain-containing protein [Patescibacteria group bacterium]
MNNEKINKIGSNTLVVLTLAVSVLMPFNTVLAAENSVTKTTSFFAMIVNFLTPGAVAQITDDRAARLDAYFAKRNMPLEGYGAKFVEVADKNGMDWKLLPAIAVRESSGGKRLMNNNPFGWGSCKIKFANFDEAIEEVGANLSGNDPDTAKYYKDKTVFQVLWAYNGSVMPSYPKEVMNIMNMF